MCAPRGALLSGPRLKPGTRTEFVALDRLKVCVISVGINRSLGIVAESTDTMLLSRLRKSRFFTLSSSLHICDDEVIDNPRSGEVGPLPTVGKEAELFDEVFAYSLRIIHEDAAAAAPDLTHLRDIWGDEYKSIRNLLAHFLLLEKAWKSIPPDADVIMLIRPDVLWVRPYYPLLALLAGKFVSFFPRWGRFGGINDRFAIMPQQHAEAYFLQGSRWQAYAERDGGLHAERYLSWLFSHLPHLNVLNPQFVRVRLGGRIVLRDFAQLREIINLPLLREALLRVKRTLKVRW